MARILVIEEELELRVALTRFLAALEHDVVALAAVGEIPQIGSRLVIPVELVVLDVPGADPRALQLITTVKDAFPGVKIVVTTKPEAAIAFRDQASMSLALGVATAIFKPYTADQLRAALDTLFAPRNGA